MRKIVAGKLQTGADFEGSKGGCKCSGGAVVENSHNAGPAYWRGILWKQRSGNKKCECESCKNKIIGGIGL